MKTSISQRIVLAASLTFVLYAPAYAAFGANTAPEAPALSGNSAPGSALPPGTYPSSPSGADSSGSKGAETKAPAPSKDAKSPRQKSASTRPPTSKTGKKAAPKSGS
ncbi:MULTISPECIES: hypothetical protein [unclassified Pseudomonas]|uniref:hypothetical protein n=1 Tax=unclassified Pseudomonas TaxID=196821 RepID=UPI0015A40495|nr:MULTISPECIES: hypothetical protein [unclassified Pseudomonas]NWC92828.1 hypothetical protein [Pseudomonas sp. IPO3779]NWD17542.1 hypothetical protein [Pseudomonas sp. IPO3778]